MQRARELWQRLLMLGRRGRLDRELEEELRFHLEMKVQEHRDAGISLEEARRRAHVALGNLTLSREDSRQVWTFGFLEVLIQDIRYAVRVLVKNPLFASVAVVTLALGIGANAAIFTMLDSLVLRRLPVERPEELFAFGTRIGSGTIDRDDDRDDTLFSWPMYQDFRRHDRVFTDLAAFSSFSQRVYLSPDRYSLGTGVEMAEARLVSGNYFSLLGVRAAIGRTFSEEVDAPEGGQPLAVISHGFWKRRFAGDPAAIGATLQLNDTPFTVIGIAPPKFFGETVGRVVDLWVPISMQTQILREESRLAARDTMWLRILGRLKPEVSEQLAASQTSALFRRLLSEDLGSRATPEKLEAFAERTIELTPMARGLSPLRRSLLHPLLLLMGVVGLVLLIACANVANLLLARAAARQHEVAVRLTVGCGRIRLLRQLLTESLILALAGACLGLLLAHGSMRLLISIPGATRTAAALDPQIDGRALAFTLVLSVLTAVLFGLVPALQATRVDLSAAIQGSAGRSGGQRQRSWLARALVVAQVAVSVPLLIGAGLFLRSLHNLQRIQTGFQPDGLLLLQIDPQGGGYPREQLVNLYSQLVEEVTAVPEVVSASFSYFSLLTGSRWRSSVSVSGFESRSENDEMVEGLIVWPSYFDTVGMRLLEGRLLEANDREGTPKVAVVNETMARHFFKSESGVGRRFGFEGPESSNDVEIVGVLEDVKYHDLREQTPRMIFLPVLQEVDYLGSMEVRTLGDPRAAVPQIRRAIQQTASGLPLIEITTMGEQLDRSLTQEDLLSRLTGLFSLLALVLASIGLYGVMAYDVARRTHEIGIRLALGAVRGDVVWAVLGEGMRLVGLGIAIGILAALAAGRVAASLLYELQPGDPQTILAATTVLLGVASVAAFLPARRASRFDPLTALRYE